MKKNFKVTRPHIGDKPYAKGDTREVDPRKVKHLIKSGVLVEITDDQETDIDFDASSQAAPGSGAARTGDEAGKTAKVKPGAGQKKDQA